MAASSLSARGALSGHAFADVARHGGRAKYVSVVIPDDREGHFDVKLASTLVQRAGQRRAALQLHDAPGHGRFEAGPVSRAQMLGDDEIETLAARFVRG